MNSSRRLWLAFMMTVLLVTIAHRALASSQGHYVTDINGDGVVNVQDIMLVAADWGRERPAPTAGQLAVSDNWTMHRTENYTYLFGEVSNGLTETVKFAEVHAAWYDQDGRLVDVDSAYLEGPDELGAGESRCFGLMSDKADIHHFDTVVEASTGTYDWYELAVVQHSGWQRSDGTYTVAGIIQNQLDVAVRFPKVLAEGIAADDRVLFCDEDYADGGLDYTLQPGDMAVFETWSPQGYPVVEGWQYRLLAYSESLATATVSDTRWSEWVAEYEARQELKHAR